MNRLKVEEIGRHIYRVKLNCGYQNWEVVQVKAINEYLAVLKALRGKLFIRLFLVR